MNEIVQALEFELEQQKLLVDKLQKELTVLPKGTLCYKNIYGHKYIYYRFYDNKDELKVAKKAKQKCMTKQDGSVVSAIKRRKFAEASIKQLTSNTKVLENALAKYNNYIPQNILDSFPQVYRDIDLQSFEIEKSLEVLEWENSLYESNPLYPEELKHITVDGTRVRSKSEAIIAGLLDVYNIPYRYEARLDLGSYVRFPDFEALRVRDKQIIYWEHFGLMGDKVYAENAYKKIELYNEHGVVLWDNFIATFDSEDGSLDVRKIQNLIKVFLL